LWSCSFVLSSLSFALTGSKDDPLVRSGISVELQQNLRHGMHCTENSIWFQAAKTRVVPGRFLSIKNTTRLTVYLWGEDRLQLRQMQLQYNRITEMGFDPTRQQQHPHCSACEKQW
jgi:hypothetical protein